MSGTEKSDQTAMMTALSGRWLLDTAKTTVELRTKALWGMAKVKGSLTATAGAGLVTPDGSVTGTFVLDAASIDTAQARRDKHLRGDDFFDVGRFPTFTYALSSAQTEPDGSVALTGTFTAHGQTNPLPLRGTIRQAGADTVVLAVEADVDRRQWGMTWTKMGAGVDIHIAVSATFARS